MHLSSPARFKTAISDVLSLVCSPIYGGVGSILCFHRVLPDAQRSQIGSNRALEVTPEFLEEIIRFLRARCYDFVSLDEVAKRLVAGERTRRFICFTFDDGYLDTLEAAHPILARHRVPFAVFLTSSYMDGSSVPWWYSLESILAGRVAVRFVWDGAEHRLPTETPKEREAAFDRLCGMIRELEQGRRDDFIREVADSASIELPRAATGLMMNWEQARTLAKDPLVTVGAHTVHHYTLCLLEDAAATLEMAESRRLIQCQVGVSVDHFSYPFGGRNAVGTREFALAKRCGFKTMTTTRGGNLFAAHGKHLECLPRFTMSGNYQTITHLRRLLSGAANALKQPFKRMVTD